MVGEGVLAREKAEKWCGIDSSLKTAFSGQQQTWPLPSLEEEEVEKEGEEEVLLSLMVLPLRPLNLQTCLGDELDLLLLLPPSLLELLLLLLLLLVVTELTGDEAASCSNSSSSDCNLEWTKVVFKT